MRLASAVLLLLAVWPVVLSGAEPSPAVIPGESRPTATRLREAQRNLVAKKWAEGVALLTSIIEGGDRELVPLKDGRSVQARLLCHLELARLPAEALALYRKNIDASARKALELALRGPEAALLARLVDEAFCSRSTPPALDRLGDLAFERGRFAEAEAWWRLLAPLSSDRDDTLAYPGPPAALAERVRAKQLLARLFAGQTGFENDLARFRKDHPKAEGELAGRKGKYADILEAVAKQRHAPSRAGDWPTFAGAPARDRVLPAGPRLLDRLSRLGRAGPAWRFDLQKRGPQDEPPVVVPRSSDVDAARRLAFHPAVVGDVALVADARYITAYDLTTGKASTWYDTADLVGGVRPLLDLPALPDLRYTLTVADGHVYARMGSQSVRDLRANGRPRPVEDGESVLVALSPKPRAGKRQRWLVRAIDPGRKDFSVFEGAPLVSAGRVYIAASRFEGDKVVTAVRCYPAHPEDSSPLPLWRTDVCETRELLPAGGANTLQRRYRHHLLTLAGSRVVYCSHSGAVVALDGRTGQRLWALRYSRRDVREPEDEPTLRDLAPCVFARGKVYVAPIDSDTLYCLDPVTGSVIWQRDRLDVVHLLGVGQGRLIFTTWRNPRQGALFAGGLRAVGADDGSDEAGWMLPDDGGGLVPFGRGLLVGDLVLWPTVRRPFGVFAVRQVDGRQPDNPSLLHRIPSGNLVWANDCLLVADRTTLWAFVPPEKLPDPDDREALAPRDALRGARGAAARGDRDLALARYEAVLKLPGAASDLQAEARRERQDVRLAAAAEAIGQKKTDEAAGWLAQAEKGKGADRLAALLRAAHLWSDAGDDRRAVAAWQAVLREGGAVEDAAGTPRRARRLALLQIDRRLTRSGAGLAEVDRQAKAILSSADSEGRDRVTNRLAREVPFAPAARAALAAEARAAAKARRFERSAWWWGWLVATLPPGKARAEALIGLAGAWDEMGCHQAARLAWLRLAREQPGRRQEVRQRLQGTNASPVRPALRLPLLADLALTLPTSEQFLAPPAREGPGAARLWSRSRRGELVCRDRHTGAVRWRAALGFEPAWLEALGHLVLVAGARGVAALDGATGERFWFFPAPPERLYPQSPASVPRVPREARPGGALDHFHLGGERLFLVRGQRSLLALDALTGEALWRRHAPGAEFEMPAPRGRLHHLLPLGLDRLLVQVSGQGEIVDAASGRAIHTWPDVVVPWPRPPVALADGSVLVVPGGDRVVCLGPGEKKLPRWVFAKPGKTTRTGEPPLVLAEGDRVVVVVPENLGPRLVRLDLDTGKVLWRGAPLVDVGSTDGAGWLIGTGRTLYHAEGNRLWAWFASNGKLAWQRDLPRADSWRLAQSGETLLASPARCDGLGFRFRWLAGSVQWRIGPWPIEPTGLAFLCLDARSGELVERLNLPAERLTDRLIRSSAPRSALPWLEAGRMPGAVPDPVLWWDRQGLVLGVPGQVRALTMEPRRSHPRE